MEATAHGGTQTTRAAEILREAVIAGRLPPGTSLKEGALAQELAVSRGTLREAFRLLAHDGLVVHRPNRGVFIPRPGLDDLRDLYRVRSLVEPQVVAGLAPARVEGRLGPLSEAVRSAEDLVQERRWPEVITVNLHFHELLVGLGDSPRLSELIRRVLAETRLVFHVVDDVEPIFAPYVGRNRDLLTGLEQGRFQDVADDLRAYLRDSEQALRAAYVEAGGWA